MSFDLGVWDADKPLTADEAADHYYDTLCRAAGPDAPASPRVVAFADEIRGRWPDRGGAAESADSPWAFWPLEVEPTGIVLHIAGGRAGELRADVVAAAERHGLVVFDPQADEVHLPSRLSGTVAAVEPYATSDPYGLSAGLPADFFTKERTLAVWEADRLLTDAEAAEHYRVLSRDDGPEIPPGELGPGLAAYLERMREDWPPDAADSVWVRWPPVVRPGGIVLTVHGPQGGQAHLSLGVEALRFGLFAFDPDDGEVQAPGHLTHPLPEAPGPDGLPVAPAWMHPGTHASIVSLAPVPNPDALADIGRALDADPLVAPSVLDLREAPTKKIDSAERAITGHARRLLRRDEIIYFERTEDPEITGTVHFRWAAPEWWDEADLIFDERLLREPETRDAIVAQFARLCVALDAFHGTVPFDNVYEEQIHRMVAMRRHRPASPGAPRSPDYRRGLGDVGWVNFYGPAYVDRWRDRLSRLGVRREPTANGGLLVWATETPFVYDPSARRSTDYPWRRPFLDLLPGAYLVEDADPIEVGQLVPTLAEHAAAATRYTGRGPDGRLRTPA